MPPPEMQKVIFSPDRGYRYWLGAKLADGDGVCQGKSHVGDD